MRIKWIGHAGFIVEADRKCILIDPWFNPAFLGTWRPQPDNGWLEDEVAAGEYDYLYISHGHEDHDDKRFQSRLPYIERIGSSRGGRDGDLAWMRFVDEYRGDSMLLVDDGERAVLFANDCNLDRCTWPKVDILACQFSGASYYPTAYDYPPNIMRLKIEEARRRQMDMLVAKVKACGARYYIPCAGPARIEGQPDGPGTPFPFWDEVSAEFRDRCPDVQVMVPRLGEWLFDDGSAEIVTTFTKGNTTFTMPRWLWEKIKNEECTWEEALLSFKIKLHRDPDVYDRVMMETLRGRNPE